MHIQVNHVSCIQCSSLQFNRPLWCLLCALHNLRGWEADAWRTVSWGICTENVWGTETVPLVHPSIHPGPGQEEGGIGKGSEYFQMSSGEGRRQLCSEAPWERMKCSSCSCVRTMKVVVKWRTWQKLDRSLRSQEPRQPGRTTRPSPSQKANHQHWQWDQHMGQRTKPDQLHQRRMLSSEVLSHH